MLTVRKLNVFYGDAQALWDVSFNVSAGKIVALIGANGAGKTTTLRTISNLIKTQSGEVTIGGEVTTGMPGYRVVEKGVAHIPEGRQLFPLMTVEENLRIGSILKRAKSDRGETIREMYDLFPILSDRRNQLAETLSGGEQQMLAIARGLMLKPKLILLDEPSMGLAPLIVSQIFDIIKEVNNRGITVLFVEQNVQRSLEIAEEAYVLENGRIVMSGKGMELIADDHIKKAYLGI